MSLRKSAFSGSWYPADARACEDQIKDFLKEGKDRSPSLPNPVGGIVPHAGWYFSGSIACNVIHQVAKAACTLMLWSCSACICIPVPRASSCPKENGKPLSAL